MAVGRGIRGIHLKLPDGTVLIAILLMTRPHIYNKG